MKAIWLALFLALASIPSLAAQKDSSSTRPTWAAGIYGSVSVGYGAFSQPFKHHETVTPYPSFAASGMAFHWDFGVSFRKRWGLRASANAYAASNHSAAIESAAKAMFPGYIVDYAPLTALSNKTVNHFAVGVSYVFLHRRWYFQPEVLLGSTEVYGEWATLQAKEPGTHQVVVWKLRPKNYEYRSPTITLGGRAAWQAGWYWGLFADVRMNGMWYNLEYQVDKTSLVEQSLEKETIHLKKTALGATASMGIFLQIARWE